MDAVCRVKTTQLEHGAGSATISVFLHTVDVGNCLDPVQIIEKLIPVSSSTEISAYRRLLNVHPQSQSEMHAKHPKIYRILDEGELVRIYMEYIQGRELVVNFSSARAVGAALGGMSHRYGQVFSDSAPYDKGRTKGAHFAADESSIIEIMGKTKESNEVLQAIEDFRGAKKKITDWQNTALRVFCHNDMKSTNAIVPSNRPLTIYVIDWASPGYDSAGSDIGGLFLNSKFALLEQNGKARDIEEALFIGYLAGLGVGKNVLCLDDIRLAANLHFAVRFFSWAIKSKNKKLLLRCSRRANAVVKLLS